MGVDWLSQVVISSQAVRTIHDRVSAADGPT